MTDTKTISMELEKSLNGIPYPASKQELINYAKAKSATKDVVGLLNSLPDRQYANMEDVASELEGRGM
jgi:hypothetical protein